MLAPEAVLVDLDQRPPTSVLRILPQSLVSNASSRACRHSEVLLQQ